MNKVYLAAAILAGGDVLLRWGNPECVSTVMKAAELDAILNGKSLRSTNTALRMFVDTINSTGGVMRNSRGVHQPCGDPTWSDLGAAYMSACEELGLEPRIRSTSDV